MDTGISSERLQGTCEVHGWIMLKKAPQFKILLTHGARGLVKYFPFSPKTNRFFTKNSPFGHKYNEKKCKKRRSGSQPAPSFFHLFNYSRIPGMLEMFNCSATRLRSATGIPYPSSSAIMPFSLYSFSEQNLSAVRHFSYALKLPQFEVRS